MVMVVVVIFNYNTFLSLSFFCVGEKKNLFLSFSLIFIRFYSIIDHDGGEKYVNTENETKKKEISKSKKEKVDIWTKQQKATQNQ